MLFSTLQQSITSTGLAAYRGGGRVTSVLATYRAGGRLQANVVAIYRGGGRLAAMGDYRGSEHGLLSAFITTRTNGYPA